MTFALKDFDELKRQFNDDVVTVILLREQREKSLKELPKIEDLPPKRRDELLFLTAILKELDSHKSSNRVAAFYGAMLLIQKDIELHLNSEGINLVTRLETKENSLLYTSLNELMGISDKNKPTDLQVAEFYKESNHFLARIFTEHDSRKGLNKQHALQVIPFERLAALVKTGYKQEERANKVVTAKLGADGKSHAPAWPRGLKEIPESLISAIGTWDQLKNSLNTLIRQERAAKNKAAITSLSTERVTQLQFLNMVVNALSSESSRAIPEAQKVAILAGCMHIVRAQINIEYNKAPLSRDDIPKGLISGGSVVHDELTNILKAKEESVENIEALVAAANHYIQYMSIEKIKDKGAEKVNIREKHMFSDIEGFKLTSILDLTQLMIKTCRIEALNRCVTELKKEIDAAKPKEVNTSYFSSAYNWFKKSPTVEEDDDEEEEECDATTEATSNTGPV